MAKITPGSIVLFTFFAILPGNSNKFSTFFSDLTFWSLIIFLGISWITGIAIQAAGETENFISYYPKNLSPDQIIKLRLDFINKATDKEMQENERTVVIKEASGNAGTAIIISLFLFLSTGVLKMIMHYPIFIKNNAFYIPILLIMVIFLFRLRIMHKRSVDTQHKFMTACIAKKQMNTAGGIK